ncbi:MAG: thiamine phosphate synthase [Candidatus Omnitrophica bacterium]|nr:thiamine phosphate synthase [Candidatus Omnitrophota bacterium]
MRGKNIFRHSLYAILDLDLPYLKKDPFSLTKDLICGGIDILQLRAKSLSGNYLVDIGMKIKKITKKKKVIFIINDRVDIAKAIDADGVHLGQEDLPVNLARRILGKNKIIGLSTHNLYQAKRAQLQDIDYISVGPVFKSPTKPNLKPLGIETLRKIIEIVNLPIVAIGGINLRNIQLVLSSGVESIALISAILRTREIVSKVKLFKRLITNSAYGNL